MGQSQLWDFVKQAVGKKVGLNRFEAFAVEGEPAEVVNMRRPSFTETPRSRVWSTYGEIW